MKRGTFWTAAVGGSVAGAFILLSSGAGRMEPEHGHGAPAPKTAEPAHKPAQPAEKPGDKTDKAKPADKTAEKPKGPVEIRSDAKDDHAPAAGSRVDQFIDRSGGTGARSEPVLEKIETADDALAALRAGNKRWLEGATRHPNVDSARRREAAEGQKPFVSILTCSDSRLPVERVFDRGIGEIFAVRVAGNIAGTSETGTLEYGLGHLHTPLLVVMGHTKCGAVAAAVSGAQVHGSVAKLVEAIQPAVERARRKNPGLTGDELAAAAVEENVWQTIFDLYKKSPDCGDLVLRGEVKVVGAIYDITTGEVKWLGEHPWQSEIISALRDKDGALIESKPDRTTTEVPTEVPSGHDHE